MRRAQAFHGAFVHAKSRTEIAYIHSGLILISRNGVIQAFEANVAVTDVAQVLEDNGAPLDTLVVYLRRGEFMIPGLVDTHTHAVQYPNVGLGQQWELLDWLQKVTFPREQKFSDPVYARKTFEVVVSRVIRLGTTTCCYYSSLHLEASKILADICHEKGQRAFVGKCNMDRNAPIDYKDKSAAQSLEDTKEFVRHVRTECCSPLDPSAATVTRPVTPSSQSSDAHYGPISARPNRPPGLSLIRTATPAALSSLVKPIITPRFAISCTDTLLAGLSALVTQDPTLHIQTHLAENPSEVAFTRELFPFADSYAHVYDHFSLLTSRTILAHCVHLEPKEMTLIANRGSGISHCPTSNFNLRSGASPIGELLDRGIKVGLGTDVSGGFGVGILSALREASVSAKVVAMGERDREAREQSRGRSKTPVATTAHAASHSAAGNEGERGAIGPGKPNGNTPAGLQASLSSPATRQSAHFPPSRDAAARGRPGDGFADRQLSVATLFYLATLGGAAVCGLADEIGNFVPGKEFDACLIQTGQKCSEESRLRLLEDEALNRNKGDKQQADSTPSACPEADFNPSMFVEPDDTLEELFEKFLFTGDDRNIASVFVRGRRIGGARLQRDKV